jgi:hypothetical protein
MPTDATTVPTGLLLRVRRLIEDGRLPADLDSQIDASYGEGGVCSLCDQPIARTQVEYDCSDARTAKNLSFHFPCYAIWQRECKLRVADSGWAKWAD